MLNHELKLEFAKYILLAINNLFINYVIFSCAVYVSGDYIVSISVASASSLIINFMTLKNILFKKTIGSFLFFRYLSAYFVCYIFNLILLKIFIQFNLSIYISGLIALPPSALLGFLLVKKFVFTNSFGSKT